MVITTDHTCWLSTYGRSVSGSALSAPQMGIGLVSYGIQNGRMSTAVEILLAAFDGEFFAD
jgi:hypothetical protein